MHRHKKCILGLFLLGAVGLLPVFAGSFKGEIKSLVPEYASLVDLRKNPMGDIGLKTTFSYEFFTLMGTPCQKFDFDHEIFEIRLTNTPEGRLTIRKANRDTKYNRFSKILELAPEDFNRLKVDDFVYLLSWDEAYGFPRESFPGYIIGQHEGAFDVPAALEWNEWVKGYNGANLSTDFLSADKAKTLFVMLENLHEDGDALSVHYSEVQFNSSELTSILAKEDLLWLYYGKGSEMEDYLPLLDSYREKGTNPASQISAYNDMVSISDQLDLPAEFRETVEAVNRDYFNRYISENAPLNFGADAYRNPAKMNELLRYYKIELSDALAYSDLSLDFDLSVPVRFTVVATKERVYIPSAVNFSLTSTTLMPSGLSSAEQRRWREKRERSRERAAEKERERKRKAAEAARRLEIKKNAEFNESPSVIEKTSDEFLTTIGFDQLINRSEVIEQLNLLYSEKTSSFVTQLSLPEMQYHKWKTEIKWNLPE